MFETSAAIVPPIGVQSLGHVAGGALRVLLEYPMMRPSMSSLC
jgi:hypothetical protein